jgi:hypothetical protein
MQNDMKFKRISRRPEAVVTVQASPVASPEGGEGGKKMQQPIEE